MNFCIRCNPISELLTTEDGGLTCRFHDKNYLLETRPDPVVEPVAEEVPVEAVSETAPSVDTEVGE